MVVNCPICQKQVVWSNINIYRPFCSKYCQSVDLNEWITEEKGIPNFSDDLNN